MSATMLLIIIGICVLGAVLCLVTSFGAMGGGTVPDSEPVVKSTANKDVKMAPKKDASVKEDESEDESNKFNSLLRYNNKVIGQDDALKIFKNIGLTGVTYKAKNRFGIFSAVSISGVQINIEDTNQYREIRQFLHDYEEFSCTVEITGNGKNAIVIFEAVEGEYDHENVLSGVEVLDAVQRGILSGKPVEFILYDSTGKNEILNYNLKRHNEEYFMLPMILGRTISGANDYRMAAFNNDIKIVSQVKEM